MMIFSYLRNGLVSSALLLSTALSAPALANSTQALPELSPRQIANDVKLTRNPVTGFDEFLAPSFDPFENDTELAGTAQLRSANNAITIDGQRLAGGAILDLSFYYNTESSDPYDNRGYGDAVYLSGEYAPVTLRDNRVLECAAHVQDVIYHHEDYYAPTYGLSLYRPYRHYTGFSTFGGLGYGGFSSFGTFIGSNRLIGRGNFRTTRRITPRGITVRGTRNNLRDGRNANGNRRANDDDNVERRRERREERRTRIRDRRGDAGRSSDSASVDGRRGVDRAARRARNDVGETPPGSNRRGALGVTRNDRTSRRLLRGRSGASLRTERLLSGQNRRTNQPKRSATVQNLTSSPVQPKTSQRSQSRREKSQGTRGNKSARKSSNKRSNKNSAGSNKSRNSARPSSSIRSSSFRSRRMVALSPMASFFGRNSRNVANHCAREEKLSVHISQDRLDAARFDGMTVIVLDRAGYELPVFIPPNYVEGFRQAVAPIYRESSSYSDPSYSGGVSSYSYTEGGIESFAPITPAEPSCSVGNSLENDGSCLAGGYTGYPTY